MKNNKKLYIALAALAVTSILTVTAAMQLPKNSKNEQDNLNQDANTAIAENRVQENKAIDSYVEVQPTQVPEENTFLTINTDQEIDKLIKKYYKSQLKVDKKLYDSISVDSDSMDVNVTARKVEYIESYDNIVVHVAKGNEAIDLVAYVEYDLHINSIETSAPSIDRFFIKYIDGEPKLYFDKLYPKTAEYFNSVHEHEEVQELIKTVDEKFIAALKSDDKLNDFYTSVIEETINLKENNG